MTGVAAALSAARHGAKTVIVQDRPVFGGNASSECRVHITGADRSGAIKHMRETGILEELRLENLRRNPQRSHSVWDTILYEKVRFQENLEMILNCSVLDAETEGDFITTVTGWQLTTEEYHRVKAKVFIDCSGDGVLAPLTGAEFRIGREARSEFGESIAPEVADRKTMGLTCYFQAREHGGPMPFTKPPWAHTFESPDEIPYGAKGLRHLELGYWWIELGGEDDSIRDTEKLRDELLKITFGVWDHIKNRGDYGADNWALEWVQFLPGKRESRRYVGDHLLTQNDVEGEGRFEDTVAYGGWTMDDHDTAGFRAMKLGRRATIFHPAPSPFGIPYRSLCSRNVGNLMFAGRDVSATHAAMSSTRVMGTCVSMGQAAGTAAAIAVREGVAPREVGARMKELQQTLLRDDCYLPWVRQEFGELTASSKLTASRGDPEPLRDGTSRQVGDDPHCWTASPGDWVGYEFGGKRRVEQVTLVLDSAMDRSIQMFLTRPQEDWTFPGVVPKRFRIVEYCRGGWDKAVPVPGETTVAFSVEVTDNHQRLVRIPVGRELEGVGFILDEIWGSGGESRVYAFYVD